MSALKIKVANINNLMSQLTVVELNHNEQTYILNN